MPAHINIGKNPQMKSANAEQVILVDAEDQIIGQMEKISAHQQPHLHRAFSIFILQQTPTGINCLLQQRAKEKYHCAGLWTNACCSHPRPNEQTIDAAQRRLEEELASKIALQEIGSFIYQAKFDNDLHEHEFDHVFIGWHQGETITPNPDEIENIQWLPLDKISQAIENNPEKYTPWLKPALDIVIKHLKK